MNLSFVARALEEFHRDIERTLERPLPYAFWLQPKVLRERAKIKEKKNLVGKDTSTAKDFEKLTCAELKQIAKSGGLKQSGTKAEIISRLIDSKNPQNKSKAKMKIPTARSVAQIVATLQASESITVSKRNGYFMDDNHFVFHPLSKMVYGKYESDKIRPLTEDDLQKCIEMGYLYEMPENLDFGNVKVKDDAVLELSAEDFTEDYVSEEDEEDEEYGA